jgi:hypothetical protein
LTSVLSAPFVDAQAGKEITPASIGDENIKLITGNPTSPFGQPDCAFGRR